VVDVKGEEIIGEELDDDDDDEVCNAANERNRAVSWANAFIAYGDTGDTMDVSSVDPVILCERVLILAVADTDGCRGTGADGNEVIVFVGGIIGIGSFALRSIS